MGDHGKTPSSRWRNEGILPGFQAVGISRRLEVHDLTLYELRYLLHHHGFTIDRICTNRYKISHLLPLPLAPLIWAATGLTVFLKCRKTGLQHMRYEIWRQMTSFPMLFGETVVLRAFKEKPSSIRI